MTAERERLPNDRTGITHRFRIFDSTGRTTTGYIQYSVYEDGRLGELFIKVGKPGEETAVWDEVAKLFSLGLQYGIPVEVLCEKMRATQFEPSGSTSYEDIPRCTSISDYIARYILKKFGKVEETVEEVEIPPTIKVPS